MLDPLIVRPCVIAQIICPWGSCLRFLALTVPSARKPFQTMLICSTPLHRSGISSNVNSSGFPWVPHPMLPHHFTIVLYLIFFIPCIVIWRQLMNAFTFHSLTLLLECRFQESHAIVWYSRFRVQVLKCALAQGRCSMHIYGMHSQINKLLCLCTCLDHTSWFHLN